MEKAGIDLVFHGETEWNMPVFLDNFSKKKPLHDIPGVSHLRNGAVTKNKEAEQISDLDTIPFPAYHLIDMAKYADSIDGWLSRYGDVIRNDPKSGDLIGRIKGKKTYISIVTSRGCTHRCFFCYRHVRGVRRHSVGYVIEHIKHLQKTYSTDGFQFCDELFNSDPAWVFDLCKAIEKEKLDIFYLIGGARIDKVDENMLRSLKRTGCIEINYGQESGSDTVLKEYRKGVTARKNKEITLLTSKEVGLHCPIQLVIGAPGETSDTIKETIGFLKDLDATQASLNYLIPLPETPSWQYAQDKKLIPDTEAYLDLVAEEGGSPIVNLTGADRRVWKSWGPLIWKELQLNAKKKSRPGAYFIYFLFYNLVYAVETLIPAHHRRIMRKCVRSILRRD
ncbi:MAG: radical SAM protein [Candidatus Omnitrophica bacterium]|nr:radical SAM protein [Candidatus Omnitrophota bacterium]